MDSPLSAVGWQQAERAARLLAHAPLRAIYASPLKRALDTAQRVAVPHALPVIPVLGLQEIHQGVWESLRFAEVQERFGELVHAWWTDPVGVRVPGGETIGEVRTRAMAALHEIVQQHPGETIAVVAHGGVNKTILLTLLGAPLASYWRVRQGNGCINVLEFANGQATVLALNHIEH